MKIRRFNMQIALLLGVSLNLYAVPVEDKAIDEILNEVRLSRIPKIIEVLEEKGNKALQIDDLKNAKEYLRKALVLKQSIGMKDTEGSAGIITKISKIENKLGNNCEATKLSKLAKRIYRQIGVNFGAVSFEDTPVKPEATNCPENLTWLKD